jgi:hypothetical protein
LTAPHQLLLELPTDELALCVAQALPHLVRARWVALADAPLLATVSPNPDVPPPIMTSVICSWVIPELRLGRLPAGATVDAISTKIVAITIVLYISHSPFSL